MAKIHTWTNLTRLGFLNDELDAIWTSLGAAVTDHGALSGLDDDDHTHYSLADGTRAFTGKVSGIDPTADAHLSTKKYVDDEIAGATSITQWFWSATGSANVVTLGSVSLSRTNTVTYLVFPHASTAEIMTTMALPEEFVGKTVSVYLVTIGNSDTGNMRFFITAKPLHDGDGTAAGGTAVTIAGNNDQLVHVDDTTINMPTSVASDAFVVIRVRRGGNDAEDTSTRDLRLIGLLFKVD